MELEDLDNELWLKEYKKKRRAQIQELVDASMLTEQEIEWMEEYASQVKTGIQVERIVFPNFFDMHAKNYHKESNSV